MISGNSHLHPALLPSLLLSERRYCDAQRYTVSHAVCMSAALVGGEGNVLYPIQRITFAAETCSLLKIWNSLPNHVIDVDSVNE